MKFNRKLTILAWAMYDFAGTIFSMNVITLYFALWVTVDMHQQDLFYSLSYSISMFLAAIIAPMIGALSDTLRKKIPFLIALTLITCVFTSAISFTNRFVLALCFFAIANFCFQLGDIIYNALLPDVSENQDVGKVSGFGKSLAYTGTIIGLIIISPFAIRFGRHATFLPSSLIFILFSLPCFFMVKDKPRPQTATAHDIKKAILGAFRETYHTIQHIKQFKGLGSFLISVFFAFNSINTIFIFMSVYTKKVIGFSDIQIVKFYIVSSLFAIIGSMLTGIITDKIGAKKTLNYSLYAWLAALIVVVITQSQFVFWILGPIVGSCMGATWTSGRTLTADLTPNAMYGEIFGFYGLVIKMGAIVGPLVWGTVIYLFQSFGIIKYHFAIIALALFMLASIIALRPVIKQRDIV